MNKEESFGILIILGIMAIALFGGARNADNNKTPTNDKNATVEQKIKTTQNQIIELKKQLEEAEAKKSQSEYTDIVNLSQVNRSTNPAQEYITIKVSSKSPNLIPVTGWKLKSQSTGVEISIPKATYLFFTGMQNVEENVLLSPGDTLYLVTGISPNGASFRVNKCSGYLGQFQTFIPYLKANCPLPEDEDLSSIPNRVINDACFDYIDSMPRCKIQTQSLPANWSHECMNFIYDKINYPSCVNTHKNDPDFYQKEWRVYLKRSNSLWKTKKETLVLYDSLGKIVDTLKY